MRISAALDFKTISQL